MFVVVLLIAGVLLLPPWYVSYIFANQIQFDPVRFVNEYLKFDASLILLLTSFILINIFWKRHLQNQQFNRHKQIILRFSFRVENLAEQCIQLLTTHYDESEGDENHKRDKQIQEILKTMADFKDNMFMYLPGIDTEVDTQLAQVTQYIFIEIIPIIGELKYANFRVDYDDVCNKLNRLVENIKEIRHLLTVDKE